MIAMSPAHGASIHCGMIVPHRRHQFRQFGLANKLFAVFIAGPIPEGRKALRHKGLRRFPPYRPGGFHSLYIYGCEIASRPAGPKPEIISVLAPPKVRSNFAIGRAEASSTRSRGSTAVTFGNSSSKVSFGLAAISRTRKRRTFRTQKTSNFPNSEAANFPAFGSEFISPFGSAVIPRTHSERVSGVVANFSRVFPTMFELVL